MTGTHEHSEPGRLSADLAAIRVAFEASARRESEEAAQEAAGRAAEARYLTNLRIPHEPFGIAAGSIRTGHNAGETHPAWCHEAECTAGAPNFAHHLSGWTILYPGHGGEAAVLVRLYADVVDPAEEPPTVEIVLMRPGQSTSIEGYELNGVQALQLAQTLGIHGQAAANPGHWNAEVQS